MKRFPFLGLGLLAAFLLSASPHLLAHDSGSSGGSSDSGHGSNSDSGHSGGSDSHGGSSGGGGHSSGSDSHGGGSGGGGHSGNSDHGGGGGHFFGSSGHDDGSSHHDHGQNSPFHNGASVAGFASHGATGSNVHHGPNGSFFQSTRHWEMRNFNPVTGAMFHSAERSAVEERFRSSLGSRQSDRSHTTEGSRSRPWDPRRDALFHGHRFHRFHDAWVLIDDGSDPADDFEPPPAPYQFTDSDFPGAPSDDENVPDSIAIAVQTRLARRGYYHGKIDGILGPESRDAISAFQTATGLRVTGYVNMDLIEALKL